MEHTVAEHISEKSQLQTEALKDKQLVMMGQTELAQLKLQLKELELENKSIATAGGGAVAQQQPDAQKDELFSALLKSNMEL